MFRLALTLTLLTLSFTVSAQADYEDGPFHAVDSFAKTVKYQHDIYLLTKKLTDPYPDQLQRTRAIFIWITNNIRYDHKFINSGREIKMPECDPGIYCQQVVDEWEKKYIKKILRKKKAICDGYARLFKKMCDIAGIRCEIIEGYIRTKPYQVGSTGPLDHAWNAVWIDSAYYLMEPTWAAGGCEEDEDTGKLLPFKKDYSDYYWCIPFDKLARDHYPKDAKWVFPGYTKDRFAANPYYATNLLPDIDLISPASGIIQAAKGDTIHFKFRYAGAIEKLQINSNIFRNPAIGEWLKHPRYHIIWKTDTVSMKMQRYTPFERHGNIYEFDYVVRDSSLYYLELLFNYHKVMRFNVNIKKDD